MKKQKGQLTQAAICYGLENRLGRFYLKKFFRFEKGTLQILVPQTFAACANEPVSQLIFFCRNSSCKF